MKKRIFILFVLGLMAPAAALAEGRVGQLNHSSLDRGSIACSTGYKNIVKERNSAVSGETPRVDEKGNITAQSAR